MRRTSSSPPAGTRLLVVVDPVFSSGTETVAAGADFAAALNDPDAATLGLLSLAAADLLSPATLDLARLGGTLEVFASGESTDAPLFACSACALAPLADASTTGGAFGAKGSKLFGAAFATGGSTVGAFDENV